MAKNSPVMTFKRLVPVCNLYNAYADDCGSMGGLEEAQMLEEVVVPQSTKFLKKEKKQKSQN